jgi:hypothetical protein
MYDALLDEDVVTKLRVITSLLNKYTPESWLASITGKSTDPAFNARVDLENVHKHVDDAYASMELGMPQVGISSANNNPKLRALRTFDLLALIFKESFNRLPGKSKDAKIRLRKAIEEVRCAVGDGDFHNCCMRADALAATLGVKAIVNANEGNGNEVNVDINNGDASCYAEAGSSLDTALAVLLEGEEGPRAASSALFSSPVHGDE